MVSFLGRLENLLNLVYYYDMKGKKRNLKAGKWLLITGLVIVLIPVVSLLMSVMLSNVLNCETAYAGENVCKVGGSAAGDITYNMYVFGFYIFYTLPLGLILMAASSLIHLSNRVKRREK